MKILSKYEYCSLFVKQDPERFILSVSPWGTPILIDKEFEAYNNPNPYRRDSKDIVRTERFSKHR